MGVSGRLDHGPTLRVRCKILVKIFVAFWYFLSTIFLSGKERGTIEFFCCCQFSVWVEAGKRSLQKAGLVFWPFF